jgi:hypothetical protein|tara:strand:+ start:1401 stop:1604 length:204 start_codon:yes stop_codon:yes gene_type:complete
MKNKFLPIILLVLAIIVLFLVNLKYKNHNLNKVIEACVVAQKQTSKNFNINEAKKYCEKEIKARMNE